MGPMYNLGHFLAILGEFLAKKVLIANFDLGRTDLDPKFKKKMGSAFFIFYRCIPNQSFFIDQIIKVKK